MRFTVRDLTPEDAEAVAALMLRIEADHPTGFCLGAGEVLEIMRDKPDSVFEGWNGLLEGALAVHDRHCVQEVLSRQDFGDEAFVWRIRRRVTTVA